MWTIHNSTNPKSKITGSVGSKLYSLFLDLQKVLGISIRLIKLIIYLQTRTTLESISDGGDSPSPYATW